MLQHILYSTWKVSSRYYTISNRTIWIIHDNSKNRIDIRKITAASYAAVLQTLKKPDQIQGKPEKMQFP